MAINPKKHEMPAQDPEVRAHNFEEVALGYDAATALDEAARFLNCKNRPCVAGCPVNVQIPEFIQKVKEGNSMRGGMFSWHQIRSCRYRTP